MHHFSPTDTDRLDPRRRSRQPRPPRAGGGTTLRVAPSSLRDLRDRLLALLVRIGR